MYEKNVGNSTNILSIAQIAVMSAIICVATFTIKIPTYTGYVHIGDSMVLLSVVLLGRKKSIVASAIGMGLTDILSGYIAWAPFTIIIKAIMAYIAGKIIYRKNVNENRIRVKLIGFILAGIWMVIGYYFAGIIISKFILFENVTLNQAFLISLKEIPSNMVQAIVGIAIAIPVSELLKKSKLIKA